MNFITNKKKDFEVCSKCGSERIYTFHNNGNISRKESRITNKECNHKWL